MVMKRILSAVLVAVVGFCSPASAQTTTPNTQPRTELVVVQRAEDIREDLRRILEKYPASVGEVLRRDPSLMARPDYMAAYPDLVKFLEGRLEIPRNVEYYFEGYGSYQNRTRLDPAFEALGTLLGAIAVAFVLILFATVVIWLVRAFIQHRRWLKASSMQADIHGKLMDRMTTNEELLAYVQSPAGRKFLEAAPVRPDGDGPSFSAPIGSIIWSMMAGVVLTILGVGFRYAGSLLQDEAQEATFVVGVVILSLGVGFIFASMLAYAVSSRLGLFPARGGAAAESQSPHA